MNAEKQYRESSSDTALYRQGRICLNLVDNRPEAITQTKLINDIQNNGKMELSISPGISIPQASRKSTDSVYLINNRPVQNSVIQCVLAPHILYPLPRYELAISYNWGQWETGNIDNVQMIPESPLTGNSPMVAFMDPPYKIKYDPKICGAMSPQSVYFILLHELTHIDAPDQTNKSISQIDKEVQADDSAALNLIKFLPNIAIDCLTGIIQYFKFNKSLGDVEHPADSIRGDRISDILTAAKQLHGTVDIQNDDNISEENAAQAMQLLGYDEGLIKRKLEEANSSGFMKLYSANGKLMTFDEISAFLISLDLFEKRVRITFQLEINWSEPPESIFAALNEKSS